LREFARVEQAEPQGMNMDPDSWQAQLEMAKSLCGQGPFVLALRELDLQQRDFPDVHLIRGNVLMRLERRQEAAEQFSVFLKQAPDDARRAPSRQYPQS